MDKEFILDEIRRRADENGGVPLGVERFVAEAGIPQSAWVGKYWARWGDALEEAGYARNRMNEPYPEEHLLRHLAVLARDLGRVPGHREIQMRRREDRNFPSANTFARFGNKRALVARLAEYCATESDLDDVAAICAPLVASGTQRDRAEGNGTAAADGFVYLLKSGKHYKIGRSNDAGRRFYEIRLQLPERLTVVHELRTDDPVGIERYWHERFADKRANGEWFDLTAADVRAFKRRRTFM